MTALRRVFALATLAIVVASPASAALYDDVFVFGDSLSDGGNAFLLSNGFPPYPGSDPAPGVPAPFSGRVTNGPTAAEVLALNPAINGTAIFPSIFGGTNYAVAGAATREYVNVLGSPAPGNILPPPIMTTSNQIARGYWYRDDSVVDTPQNLNINGLRSQGIAQQVNGFAATPPSFNADSSLFMLWGGANDFFIDAATAPAGAQNMVSFVETLYGAGARNFLIPNLPNLALTPFGQSLSPTDQAGLSFLSSQFNGALDLGIQTLRATKGDIHIVEVHVDNFLAALVTNPGALTALGFDPALAFTPCVSASTLSVCADPDAHVFWDELHPTAKAHAVLGEYFAESVLAPVPEPSTWAMLGSGLLLLIVAGGLKRRT